jgi:hypothetical protein
MKSTLRTRLEEEAIDGISRALTLIDGPNYQGLSSPAVTCREHTLD